MMAKQRQVNLIIFCCINKSNDMKLQNLSDITETG